MIFNIRIFLNLGYNSVNDVNQFNLLTHKNLFIPIIKTYTNDNLMACQPPPSQPL